MSDILHALIKSLDSHEKRYFRLHAGQHTYGRESTNLRLFDALDGPGEYNESALRAHFSGEAVLKQLHVAKNYLMESILKSLDTYHSDKSALARIKTLLHQVKILYDKGLYALCRKMLRKAEKEAAGHEYFEAMLEIAHWQRQISGARRYEGMKESELVRLRSESDRLLRHIGRMNNLKWTNTILYYKKTGNERYPRTAAQLKKAVREYEKIIREMRRDESAYSGSVQEKILYHNIMGTYHFALHEARPGHGHAEKCHRHWKEQFELLRSAPELIAEDTGQYLSALNNLIAAAIQLNKHEEALSYSVFFEDSRVRSETSRALAASSSASVRLYLYMVMGRLREAIAIVPSIEDMIAAYGSRMNRSTLYFFHYNIGLLFFKAGDYTRSLSYLNRILNDPERESAGGLYAVVRILELLIHFELGNHEILPYLIRSAYRFLKSRKRLYRFEDVLIRYLGKMPEKLSQRELTDSFITLKEELEALARDPFERQILEYFDFIAWLEKKVMTHDH